MAEEGTGRQGQDRVIPSTSGTGCWPRWLVTGRTKPTLAEALSLQVAVPPHLMSPALWLLCSDCFSFSFSLLFLRLPCISAAAVSQGESVSRCTPSLPHRFPPSRSGDGELHS